MSVHFTYHLVCEGCGKAWDEGPTAAILYTEAPDGSTRYHAALALGAGAHDSGFSFAIDCLCADCHAAILEQFLAFKGSRVPIAQGGE